MRVILQWKRWIGTCLNFCTLAQTTGTKAIGYELASHKFQVEIRGGLLTIRAIKFHLFQGGYWEWKDIPAFEMKFMKVIIQCIVRNSRGQTWCLRSLMSTKVLRDIDHTDWDLNFRGSSCLSQQNAFRRVKMPFVFIVGWAFFSWACGWVLL